MKIITPRHIDRLGYKWSIVEKTQEAENCVGAEVGDIRVEIPLARNELLETYDNFLGWVPHFFNRTKLLYYFKGK